MRSEEEAERTAVCPPTVMVDRLDVVLTGSCSQPGPHFYSHAAKMLLTVAKGA